MDYHRAKFTIWALCADVFLGEAVHVWCLEARRQWSFRRLELLWQVMSRVTGSFSSGGGGNDI